MRAGLRQKERPSVPIPWSEVKCEYIYSRQTLQVSLRTQLKTIRVPTDAFVLQQYG